MADAAQFTEAAAAVKHSPHAVTAWEEVESLAAELDKPDEIVALYRDALASKLEPDVAEMIGERAGGFCDEWFGDDPKVLEKILARVLELAPSSDSALQRLSVLYTVAERWTDVLALYDRAHFLKQAHASSALEMAFMDLQTNRIITASCASLSQPYRPNWESSDDP